MLAPIAVGDMVYIAGEPGEWRVESIQPNGWVGVSSQISKHNSGRNVHVSKLTPVKEDE